MTEISLNSAKIAKSLMRLNYAIRDKNFYERVPREKNHTAVIAGIRNRIADIICDLNGYGSEEVLARFDLAPQQFPNITRSRLEDFLNTNLNK